MRHGLPLGLGAFPHGRATPEPDSDDADIDVEETGTNRYSLKRDELAKAMRHSAELMTQIRAVPSMAHGTTNGLALSDIEAGSVFEDLASRTATCSPRSTAGRFRIRPRRSA